MSCGWRAGTLSLDDAERVFRPQIPPQVAVLRCHVIKLHRPQWAAYAAEAARHGAMGHNRRMSPRVLVCL